MQTHWFYPALLTEIGAFLSPLARSTEPAALLGLLVVHGMAATMLAISLYPLLPENYRRPRIGALLLLFALAFMAPVAGPLALALMLRMSFPKESKEKTAPVTIGLPEFDARLKHLERSAQGAIRSRLAKHVPEPLRLQSLLSLQIVPPRVANRILDELLADAADDIRLVAFGMLDAKEKALSQLIQRERTHLDSARSDRQRYLAARNLAELNWELVYTHLVQGELRHYILETAWSYVRQAQQYPEADQDASLALLSGRILMGLDLPDQAQAAFERSLQLGQPPASVLPYLAELAYLRHDLAEVRRLMHALTPHQLSPRVRTIVDLWTGHCSPSVFRDQHLLPHL